MWICRRIAGILPPEGVCTAYCAALFLTTQPPQTPMLTLLTLFSCSDRAEPDNSTSIPAETDTPAPSDSGPIDGPIDAGFGAAIAIGPDGALWIGAPHGNPAMLYVVEPGGELTEALSGHDRIGAAIALSPSGELAVGAPLADGYAGVILDADGQVLATGGQSAGLALTWADTWVAATATGWLTPDKSTETPGRPSAIAAMQDEGGWRIGVGMAHSETMLQVGDTTLAAPTAGGEAGYALAVGDVDNDGAQEWIIGAPAISTVYIVDAAASQIEQTLSGAGRFGAALATGDFDQDGITDLIVGAPMERSARGAAHLYTLGDLSSAVTIWTGSREGEQLGFAVAIGDGALAYSAPGAAGQSGRVLVVTP